MDSSTPPTVELVTALPPHTPQFRTAAGLYPRCSKCDGTDLLVTYQRDGWRVHLTAADLPGPAGEVDLDEHLLRTCGDCGYWWREALAVGS